MLVEIKLPPGMYRNGTQYQSRGRWYNGSLVRWYEGTLQPRGGWQAHSATAVTGKARGIQTWLDNSLNSWCGIGTSSHLYIYNHAGTQYDITPSGYTAGTDDATTGGGYGNQGYGVGLYGTPRTDTTNVADCTVWTFDVFGQYLLGCNYTDGKVYQWKLNTGVIAAPLPNTTGTAPTNNRAVMVTNEGFIFVLGAGANPRLVQWPDVRTDGVWTPALTNQAGFYQIQTPGKIMCGKRITGAQLIFTDQDVHLATYVGAPLVYGFEQVGTGCGVISQNGAIVANNVAYWMSPDGFWSFNGYAQPLESDVGDYVFSNLNANQRSKVFALHNREFGEIDWFYPQGSEIDSYVTYNYREQSWTYGSLARTCGIEAGAFTIPLMVDPSGVLWEHESGFSYSGSSMPFAETGPLEMNTQGGLIPNAYAGLIPGSGNDVFHVLQMYPDSGALGGWGIYFYGKFYPEDSDTSYGPYTQADPTSLRITARQLRMRAVLMSNTDERFGIPRLDIKPGGQR